MLSVLRFASLSGAPLRSCCASCGNARPTGRFCPQRAPDCHPSSCMEAPLCPMTGLAEVVGDRSLHCGILRCPAVTACNRALLSGSPGRVEGQHLVCRFSLSGNLAMCNDLQTTGARISNSCGRAAFVDVGRSTLAGHVFYREACPCQDRKWFTCDMSAPQRWCLRPGGSADGHAFCFSTSLWSKQSSLFEPLARIYSSSGYIFTAEP